MSEYAEAEKEVVMNIAVIIEGGCLTVVYCDQDADVDVELFDIDNMKADGKTSEECEAEAERHTGGMKVCW